MPVQYSAERSVLLKILLHAAAHPSQSVNGVLLGKVAGSKGSRNTAGDEPGSPPPVAVQILDVLPLFHSSLALAPTSEVGLIQADAYAQSQGLILVGYYHANACIDDVELGSLGKKIAERIQSHTHQACALLVDNSKLQQYLQQKDSSFLQLYVRENGKAWSQSSIANLLTDAATVPQLFMEYHAEGRHQEVVDFDDHLNDIRRDWFNPTLLQ